MLADADRVDDPRVMTWADLLARGDDTGAVDERMERITPDLPATFLYTSGTTGNPKGVVLTHHNVMYEAVSTLDAGGLHGPQRTISYLPLAHIAERILATYAPPFLGSHVHAIPDPAGLLGALGEVHPTAFFGVPRVWEKIKTGISAKLAEDPDPANQKLVTDAMAAGLAWTQAHEYGNAMTPEVEEAFAQGRRGDPRRSCACCSASTRCSGPPAPRRRCRWRSRSSWAASACRCTTSTA